MHVEVRHTRHASTLNKTRRSGAQPTETKETKDWMIPQLLDRLLVLKQLRLLLRVGVHAAHKVRVCCVNGVHERGQIGLEGSRHRLVGNRAAATTTLAARPGRRDVGGLVFKELRKELGLGFLHHLNQIHSEQVLVLLAEGVRRVGHTTGIMIDDKRLEALLQKKNSKFNGLVYLLGNHNMEGTFEQLCLL
jgi:hypothetical protein